MKHYCSLKVDEDTKKLAKELAARSGTSIKEFIKLSLEIKEQELESLKRKKQYGFNFGL